MLPPPYNIYYSSWNTLYIAYNSICKRQLQTVVSSHPLKIGHMFIWTYLLGIVHATTPYNIYCYSWNTLYIAYTSICKRQLQTAVPSHPLKIGHMFIWTYLLGIFHATSPYNIYCSSWNTLYIAYTSLYKVNVFYFLPFCFVWNKQFILYALTQHLWIQH